MTDNGKIHVKYKTICHVVSSAAEAETNGAFENALVTVKIQNLLNAMGHPQTLTIIKTDNSTTAGFINKNVMQEKVIVLIILQKLLSQ